MTTDNLRIIELTEQLRQAIEQADSSKFVLGSLVFFKSQYRIWCEDHLVLGLAQYAIDKNETAFREAVQTALHLFYSYLEEMRDLRNSKYAAVRKNEDFAALADADFARTLCYGVSCLSSTQAIEICRKSDCGAFQGKRITDSREAHLARCLRSFLLARGDQLKEEIDSMSTLAGSDSIGRRDGYFAVPKKWWQGMLQSAFVQDAPDLFRTSLLGAVKWYEQRVLPKVPQDTVIFRKAYGMPPLLALATIAIRHRGYPPFEIPAIVQPELMNLD